MGEPLGRDVALVHVLQLLPAHKSLRVTPAVAAGITDRVWELSDLLA